MVRGHLVDTFDAFTTSMRAPTGASGARAVRRAPGATKHAVDAVPVQPYSTGVALLLPDGSFKAFLFDCDGTIADSMPLHYVAWSAALAEYGCVFDEDLFYDWGGKPIAEIVASLNQIHGLAMPVDAVARRRDELYAAEAIHVKAVPDVLAHIEANHGRLPFAVVSGSTRPAVTDTLSALGILDRFNTLVCAGDYARSKPHPEPFLVAAERLGVAPGDCLVFEDTDLGVQAAVAAGMAWVKVPDPRRR